MGSNSCARLLLRVLEDENADFLLRLAEDSFAPRLRASCTALIARRSASAPPSSAALSAAADEVSQCSEGSIGQPTPQPISSSATPTPLDCGSSASPTQCATSPVSKAQPMRVAPDGGGELPSSPRGVNPIPASYLAALNSICERLENMVDNRPLGTTRECFPTAESTITAGSAQGDGSSTASFDQLAGVCKRLELLADRQRCRRHNEKGGA